MQRDRFSVPSVVPNPSNPTTQGLHIFPSSLRQAEDLSTPPVDETPGRPEGPSNPQRPPLFDRRSVTSAIRELPLELISSIVELSLPESYSGESRIKALYSTRMVSRLWRNAIDSTPSLWNVITIEVPLHVNTITIQRSGNYPLNLYIFINATNWNQMSGITELLELASREIGRWSTATLWLPSYDICSKYLTSPASRLRILRIASGPWDRRTSPLTLFGGIAPRLEELDVEGVPMDWTSLSVQRLRVLTLSNLEDYQISAQQLLHILSSSPLLEELDISDSSVDHHLQLSQMRPSIIQLPSLKSIHFEETNLEAIRIILSSIRAPNCTSLAVAGAGNDTVTTSSFPDTALGHFKDFQRVALSVNKKSCIYFFDGGMQWDSRSASSHLDFDLGLEHDATVTGVRWATSVIGIATQELVHHLEVTVNHEALDDEDMAAYHLFSLCQSIKKIAMPHSHQVTRAFLDLIGTWHKSEDGARESPAFPGLEFLLLSSRQGWSLDDLEIMVNRRYAAHADIPNLQIVLPPWYPETSVGPKWNLAQLQRLRAARGVASVTRILNQDERGLLAVVYDDDTES